MKSLPVLGYAIILFYITLQASSCFSDANLFGEPIRQYADYVISYSSQYGAGSYSANQALGKENIYPLYGDLSQAWASLTADGQREFLVLGFDSSQTVTKIEIYETNRPGGIDTIFLKSESGDYTKVYEHSAFDFNEQYPDSARILTVELDPPLYNINGIRLDINSVDVGGWQEIDAVAITGLYPIKETN